MTADALPPATRDAVAVGHCDAVLVALSDPRTDEERLAVGWCAERDGDPARAIDLLAPVESEPFASWARWTRAEALADSRRFDEALAAIDGLQLPGNYTHRVGLLRGRVLVEAGRSLEARDGLRDLLETSVAVEARAWLAQGGQDRGETTAAIATWRRVWADDPDGPWSDRAAAALERLGAPVPDYASEEGRALVRDRIATLRKAQRHDEALALGEPLHDASATSATGLALARLRFDAKDYPGAIAAWRTSLGPPADASGPAKDLFDYALATSRTGDYDTAAVIYGRVVALHPTTPEADFASFKIGYLEVDRGRCDEARARLAEHIERRPDSKHLDEALWFAGRCAWKSGDTAAALASWTRLREERPVSSLVPAAAYWTARAKGRAGDAAGQTAGLEEVLKTWPASAYAWLAAERLGRTPPATDAPPTLPDGPPAAQALLDAGFPAWARAELSAIAPPTEPPARRLAYAATRLRAGDPKGARSLVEDRCSAGSWSDPLLIAVCLPRPEAPIVHAVATRYGLDPLLPYAIMTAESGLDPSVTSAAGARGLMQLMPAEVPRIHADLYGNDAYDLPRLYEAPYNASLGTALLGIEQRALGDVLEGNDLPAVIAAYNGGSEAVRRWTTTHPEPDEFIEDIGYTETRQYVKRVLGVLMRYRSAYD